MQITLGCYFFCKFWPACLVHIVVECRAAIFWLRVLACAVHDSVYLYSGEIVATEGYDTIVRVTRCEALIALQQLPRSVHLMKRRYRRGLQYGVLVLVRFFVIVQY